MKVVKRKISKLEIGDIIASPVIFNGAIIVSKNSTVDEHILNRLKESNVKIVKIKVEDESNKISEKDVNEDQEETKSGNSELSYNDLKNKFLNLDSNSSFIDVTSLIRQIGDMNHPDFIELIKLGFQKFSDKKVITELIIQSKRVNIDKALFNILYTQLFNPDNQIVLNVISILDKHNSNIMNYPQLLMLISKNQNKAVMNAVLNHFSKIGYSVFNPVFKQIFKTTTDVNIKKSIRFLASRLKTETVKGKNGKKDLKDIKNIRLVPVPDYSVKSNKSEKEYYQPTDLEITDIKEAAHIFKDNYKKANESIKKIFTSILNETTPDIKVISGIVSTMIDQIFYNRDMVSRLRNIYTGENYLYSHSVNVSILSMLTGLFLEYDANQIAELGISALMIDIGMLKVDRDILDKKAKLTTDEFNAVKYHVFEGLDLLKKSDDLKDIIATVALQHHEREDGSGYLGLKSEDIIEYSKIVSICDVYDALTSPRNYRKPFSPQKAVNYIIAHTPDKFNQRCVQAFLKHVGVFPIGTRVILNNGKVADVTGNNKDFWSKPKIVFLDEEVEVNLRLEEDIFIQRVYEGVDIYENWSNI